jgi:superfamily II DNA or RNA helicase
LLVSSFCIAAKSLVFSQFASTLEWLKKELPEHGFQFRTLSGDMSMKKRAKALSDFQNDPPTTIFLLSMRAGAVGINLTQANRVFLMEPCFNPALEAQAIGRVHRLGQTRNVEIIRLLVKDSVESRMVEMLEKKYGKTHDEDGNSAAAGGDDDRGHDDDDDGDKKPAAKAVQVMGRGMDMAGSIGADKATVVTEEFDLLFGVNVNYKTLVSYDSDTVMGEVKGNGEEMSIPIPSFAAAAAAGEDTDTDAAEDAAEDAAVDHEQTADWI